jgi:hypothetical protein
MQESDSEDDLTDAFRISPEFGLETLHAQCRLTIVNYIKLHGLGLNSHDIDDVYEQTMGGMLKAARKPGFDPVEPLRLALTIAERRAGDRRKRLGFRRKVEGGAYQDQIHADLKETHIGLKAKYDPIDWPAFDKALWEEIYKLPPTQHVAAVCFRDNYLEICEADSYGPLAAAMSEKLGHPVSVVAAKSAWYEAKDKIAGRLTRRGFDLLGGNNL